MSNPDNIRIADLEADPLADLRTAPAPSGAGALRAVISNADITDPEQFTMLVVSELTEGVGIWESGTKALDASYFVQRYFESTDKRTGEVSQKCHTRFVSAEGTVLWTNSVAVARTVGLLLVATNGTGKFDPPLHITFTEKKLGPDQTLLVASIDPADVLAVLRKVLPARALRGGH